MPIVATGSLDGYFHELVGESLTATGVSASEAASAYLVSLLSDYSRPDRSHDEALHRPLAFLLDEAIHEQDLGARFDKLRTLGDGVLYASGFFAGRFESRGVDARYLEAIGARAYGGASAMLRTTSSRSIDEAAATLDLYAELAERFATFVKVLRDVSDATLAAGAHGARQLLGLYERWLKTGSERIAGELTASGLIPARAPRGVH